MSRHQFSSPVVNVAPTGRILLTLCTLFRNYVIDTGEALRAYFVAPGDPTPTGPAAGITMKNNSSSRRQELLIRGGRSPYTHPSRKSLQLLEAGAEADHSNRSERSPILGPLHSTQVRGDGIAANRRSVYDTQDAPRPRLSTAPSPRLHPGPGQNTRSGAQGLVGGPRRPRTSESATATGLRGLTAPRVGEGHQWRLGQPPRADRQEGGIGGISGGDRRLGRGGSGLLFQPHGAFRSDQVGALYPWLDRLRQKCHSLSTCMGRVKRAWNPAGEGEEGREAGPKGNAPGRAPGRGTLDSQEEDLAADVARLDLSFERALSLAKAKEGGPAMQRQGSAIPAYRSLPGMSGRPPRLEAGPGAGGGGGKLIYFIRHGTAYCNVCGVGCWRRDQRLTPQGWAQAAALGGHLQKIRRPQLVVVSTLSRAMETAVGAFGMAREAGSPESPSRILMVKQNRIANLQAIHPEVYHSEGGPPILAVEECRERLGETACSLVPTESPTALNILE
eukprot:evm.model.scf_662.2 EVM.evm.TU.scf_662.2   scf_662:16595-19647(-)